MNYMNLADFLEKTEEVINDTLDVEELTRVSTPRGAVIVMTETEFDCLMDMIASRKYDYNPDKKRDRS